ncbi:MAG: hypothetical protein HOP07_15805 [Bacteriovoracaceae bacterium]|nr:hypothetical protein [Bacteriovoracaceae bacterium]
MIKTKRDLLLLNFLADYGILSTKQIAHLFFTDVNIRTVLRRLRILEENKLIRRSGKLEANNEFLWLVTEKTGNDLGKKYLKLFCSKANIGHDCQLTSLRLILEKLGLVNHWISEHEIKGHIFSKYKMRDAKDKHIPDAIFDSEVAGYKVASAIELELTLKSKDRYKKIINQYLYKDDLHSVWYFVNSRSLLNALKDQFSKSYSSFSQVKIFFTLLSDLKTNGVNAKMIGLNSTSLIKNYFSSAIDSAHTNAHEVSTLTENMIDGNINLTSQNHTPNLESGFI